MALPDWPRAWGAPPVTATLRATPADFLVEEQLGFAPGGSGEHCWLWVEKENLNTADCAQRLARFAGVGERDVGYGGLKDKNAVARQWFSLHLVNRPVDWSQWCDARLRLLEITRHDRKLRRGAHRGNRFEIVLRDVAGDPDAFAARLQTVRAHGVPNYFGEQRFGRDGRNIDNARQWIAAGMPRKQRDQLGLLLSSLRSLLFNEVLAVRVADASWCAAQAGEIFALDGSNSVFAQAPDDALRARLRSGDLHLTGPLPGRAGRLVPGDAVAALEAAALQPYLAELQALERAGLEAERRALRLPVPDLQWERLDAAAWRLRFTLPRGCFATSVVRELATISPGPRAVRGDPPGDRAPGDRA